MHSAREIRLGRVKCLRAWVDLFHFTWRSHISQFPGSVLLFQPWGVVIAGVVPFNRTNGRT